MSGRPFMGPNLYIGTQSSFTHFHLDGHVSRLLSLLLVLVHTIDSRTDVISLV